MEQPMPADIRRAFGRYMSVWIPLFIGELDKAGLLDTVKNHLADSESEGGTRMRSCIEQAIAGAVDAYFNKIEDRHIINEAIKIVNRR